MDDTWNSSYKILENLSRTEHKHGVDDAGSDAEGNARTARKTRKTHARTIEKNLNNINLKAYDTECEADPLFHKMSQSFDEGGAKGMLLANLSVYDGCKILLNSSDVSVVTRKPIHEDGAKSKDKAGSPEKQATKDSATCKASDCAGQSEPLHDKDVAQAEGIDENEQKVEEAKKEEEHGVEAKDGDKDSKQAMDSEATDNSEGLDKDVAMEEERKNGEKLGLAEDVDMERCVDETPTASSDVTTEETHSNENDESTEESAVESTSVVGGQSSSSVTTTKEKESSDSLGVTKERISLSLFGSLSCIDQDVQNLSVCPPLYRMYDQLDEFYGDDSRHRLGLKNNFLHTTPVKGQRQTLDKKDAVAVNLAGIMESASEDEPDGEDAVLDASMDFGEEHTDHNDVDEDGDIIVEEVDNVVEVICVDDVTMEEENNIIDLAGSGDEDAVVEDLTHESAETDPIALDKESSLRSSAADFFRTRVNENLPEDYEHNLFSQMIESALVRSVTQDDDEQGVEDQDGRHVYSYFDAKMLRNWAGPGHWKFPAIRKIQMKQRCKEETDKDGLAGMNMEFDEGGAMIKAEPTELSADRARKGCSAGTATKTAITVDFFGKAPDFSKLRAPKSASSLEVSKGTLRKQVENASDLVLPVDTHIKVSLFFRHFLKERPRFFRKRSTPHPLDGLHRESISANDCDFGGDSLDMDGDGDRKPVFTYNEDSAGFEGGYDDDDDGDEGIGSADDPGTQSLYSVEGLVQADRVVQKIGVHYERFAKRVDVKKLKGSIWEHLEKQVVKGVGGEGADAGTAAETDVVSVNESGKRLLDTTEVCEPDASESAETTFKSVVEHVATKVQRALLSLDVCPGLTALTWLCWVVDPTGPVECHRILLLHLRPASCEREGSRVGRSRRPAELSDSQGGCMMPSMALVRDHHAVVAMAPRLVWWLVIIIV